MNLLADLIIGKSNGPWQMPEGHDCAQMGLISPLLLLSAVRRLPKNLLGREDRSDDSRLHFFLLGLLLLAVAPLFALGHMLVPLPDERWNRGDVPRLWMVDE